MPNQLVTHFRATNPERAAGLSDDAITEMWADSADQYRQQGTDLFESYPDFAADAERIREQKVKATLGIGDYAGQAWRSGVGGLIRGLGGIPEMGAAFAERATGGMVNLGPTIRRGEEALIEAVSPEAEQDPAKRAVLEKSFLATDIPSGIGSILSFMTPGVAARVLSGVSKTARAVAKAGKTTTATMGAGSGFQEQYNEALSKGADPDMAFQAGLLGAGVGLSQIVPVAKFVDRLTAIAPSAKRTLSKILAETGKETVQEALQEAFESGAGDLIAAEIIQYDPDRKLFDSMLREAAAGGVTGGLVSFLTQLISGRHAARVARPAGQEQQPPPPGEGTAPPGAGAGTINAAAAANRETTSELEVVGEERRVGAVITPEEAEAARQLDETRADVASTNYEIDDKGIDDLVRRRMEQGDDAVMVEVENLGRDARKIYERKLREAVEAKGREERQKAREKLRKRHEEFGAKLEEAIADAKANGPSPEFRAFFGGVDPEIAGTTVEKVTAYAAQFGMPYVPPGQAAPTTTTTEVAPGGPSAVQVQEAAAIPVREGAEAGQAVGQEVRGAETPAGVGGAPQAQAEVTPTAADVIAATAPAAATPPATPLGDSGEPPAESVTTPPPATAPEPAAEVAPGPTDEEKKAADPAARIKAQTDAYAVSNTGDDSREFLVQQTEALNTQQTKFTGVETLLRGALARIDAALAEQKKTGTTKEIPLLNKDEVSLLKEINDKSVKAARIDELLTRLEGTKTEPASLTRRSLEGWANLARSLDVEAEAKINQLKSKAGLITADSKGPLTHGQLLNAESINFNPEKGETGYYEVGDASAEGAAASAEMRKFNAGTKEDREAAAYELGDILLSGSRVGNRKGTKRLVAWQAPDGSIVVMSGLDQSHKRGTGDKKRKATANEAWRFTVGPTVRLQPGKKDDIAGGSTGIDTLLNAGYRPVASMAMTSFRGRLAIPFANRAAYNNAIGTAAKEAQRSANEAQAAFATSLRPVTEAETVADIAETGRLEGSAAIQAAQAAQTRTGEVVEPEEAAAAPPEAEEAPTPEQELIAKEEKTGKRKSKAERSDEEMAALARRAGQWMMAHPKISEQIVRYYMAHPKDAFDVVVNKFFGKLVLDAIDQEPVSASDKKALAVLIENRYREVANNESLLAALKKHVERELGYEIKLDAAFTPVIEGPPSGFRQDAVRGGRGGGVLGEVAQAGAEEAAPGEAGAGSEGAGVAAEEEGETGAARVTFARRSALLDQEIKNLVTDHSITKEHAAKLRSELDEILELDELEAFELGIHALIQKTRSESHADPGGPVDDDLDDDGNFKLGEDRRRALPDSELNAKRNITDALRKDKQAISQRGVSGVMSLAAAQSLFESPTAALKWAAEWFRSSDKASGEVLARIAEMLAESVHLTGVGLTIVDDANLAREFRNRQTGTVRKEGVHGRFDMENNTVVLNLAYMRDGGDMAETAAHEFVHAFLSRMVRRYYSDIKSLSPIQRQAIEAIDFLSTQAQAQGLVWQDMNRSPEVRLNEFVAAVMSDARFQAKLNSIYSGITSPVGPSPRAEKKRLTVWQAVKRAIATLLSSEMIAKFGLSRMMGKATRESLANEEQREAIIRDNLLAPTLDALGALITGYNRTDAYKDQQFISTMMAAQKRNPSADEANAEQNISYKAVEGMLKDQRDISVDKNAQGIAVTGAKRMMATTNYIESSMQNMLAAWNTLGKNVAKTNDFVKGIASLTFRRPLRTADEVKAGIFDALGVALAPQVPTSTKFDDLAAGEKEKAKRDAYVQMAKYQGELREEKAMAESYLQDGDNDRKMFEAVADEVETFKNYTDLNTTKKLFLRDMKQAVQSKSDRGATAIATALGVTNPRTATANALTRMQGNIDAAVNSVVALSRLGIDFGMLGHTGGPTNTDVLNAVVASRDPDLNMLASDRSQLAVAIMFARNRPALMDLLSMLKAGADRGALDTILRLAMSNRPDALDLAAEQLKTLPKIGAIGQRLLTQLRASKRRSKEYTDTKALYMEVVEFYDTVMPVLYRDMASLEKDLGIETGVRNVQWEATHGARYFVPQTATDKPWDFMRPVKGNEAMSELKGGDDFDRKKVEEDIVKIKEWIAANPGEAGTGDYRLMQRQDEQLTQFVGDQLDYHIKRGPLGWCIGLIGDIATRLDWTGVAHAREIAKMFRRYATLHDGLIRNENQREFLKADTLKKLARESVKMIDKDDFAARFYDRAWSFIENRPDLLDPKLTDDQQNNKSVDAALDHIATIEPELNRPEARKAVRNLLMQAIKCSDITVKVNMAKAGLKVAEPIGTNRHVFRDPVGVTAHSMSRHVSGKAMRLMTDDMLTAGWNEVIDKTMPGYENATKLRGDQVVELYTKDPTKLRGIVASRFTPSVVKDFAKELCKKPGESNFFSIKLDDGTLNKAQREYVQKAFDMSGGDMLRFAEELYILEGGDPANAESKAKFVAQTLGTFQRYFDIIYSISTVMKDMKGDDSQVMARSFLDARQGEDFPAAWLSYLQYGEKENVRYSRMLAQQAAFGADATHLDAQFAAALAQIEKMHTEYKAAHEGGISPARRAELLGTGDEAKIKANAVRIKEQLERAKHDAKMIIRNQNGIPQDYRLFMKFLGLLAGYTVQAPGTAFTDTVTMVEKPFRAMGFSKEAMQMIFGNYKGIAGEAAATLWQAFGSQLHINAEWARQTELANRHGAADPDATLETGFLKSIPVKFQEFLGDELTFGGLWLEYQKEAGTLGKVEAAKRLAFASGRRGVALLVAGARVGLETGIGRAKVPGQSAVTFKPWALFTMINQWMHRAVARQWYQTINEAIKKAAKYFKDNPPAMADPSFRFTSKTLGYSSKTLIGFPLDDKAFDYINQTMMNYGISLEEAGRRLVNKMEPLTERQVMSVMSLSQNEVLNNTGVLTRSPWSVTTLSGRMFSPLVGWSVYRLADLARTIRDPKARASGKAFKQAMIGMLFGVLPASLIYALLRDEYEEEVVGKRPNVLPLRPDRNIFLALLDNLNRVGTFGVAGDVASSIFGVSTQREFSVESRVFALSSAINLARTVAGIYQTDGAITHASVIRPMLQSLGGSGYLQYFDAINNMLELSSTERRIVRRINVNNQLRAAGRSMGLDVKVSRGIQYIPNPMKPWIMEMVLASYANDSEGYAEAYGKAIEAATNMAARSKTPDADPYADVAESLQRMHPLRSVFGKVPTTAEYQKLLREIGSGGAEVAQAIRNFNAYAAMVKTGRGKEGIKPFYGKERKIPKGVTSSFGL